MKGSEFVFSCAQSMCYKCQKINRGELYVDSPDWIKKQKSKINSINEKYNKSFQDIVTVTLNYEETGKHSKNNKN